MKIGDILQVNGYGALLKTEEWRQFAKGIRSERSNACECCRKTGVVTQVHHIFYDSALKPWEHDPGDVILLCQACHKQLHEQLRAFRRNVFRFLRPAHLEILNAALRLGLTKCDPLEFVHAVAEMAKSPGSVTRFAYAWNDGKRPELKSHEYNATER